MRRYYDKLVEMDHTVSSLKIAYLSIVGIFILKLSLKKHYFTSI
jgi:hypothetical protein